MESVGFPSIAPKVCRLNALGISSLNISVWPSRIVVRFMIEKSSFLYPGLRHQETTVGIFPKTYPPPAANEVLLGIFK